MSQNKHKLLTESFFPVKKIKENKKTRVEKHYDNIKIQNFAERKKSHFYKLRLLNNWTKNVLIDRYARRAKFSLAENEKIGVIDFCGGKFGDLPKWISLNKLDIVDYVVLIDISRNEIEEALKRHNFLLNEMTGRKINMPFVELFVADCFNKPLKQVLHNRIPLDLVSCQFALHYCFEDEETAHKTIKNVSDCLRKGGYFIGTVPDANVIIKTLRTKGNLKNGKVGIGNKNFKIEIDNGDSSDNDNKNGGKIKLAFPPNKKFGLRYKFHLKNSVDKCDEFLVHPETLMRLCDSFGLKCDLFQNFHDFYEETVTMQFEENDWARELFLNKVIENTKKIDKTKMFPSEDWEIAGFYAVFAFRKIDGAESKSDSFNQKFRKVRFLDKSEIK